jgi:hypothetical protein
MTDPNATPEDDQAEGKGQRGHVNDRLEQLEQRVDQLEQQQASAQQQQTEGDESAS